MAILAATALTLGVPGTASSEEAPEREELERDERGGARTSDIIVTGRSLDKESTVLPVQVLAGEELAHRRQGGLGETLAGLPGVHLDNFGGGASRPVIRGQTLPRIEVLTDGANLFDVSSISPDHAITTDPLLLDAIEIQRGPAAIRYGGNATNGAINLIDSKVPKAVPLGGLSGATEVRYGTGDEEKTVVGRVTAGIGQFAVHAEGARRSAEDYDVPGGYGADTLRDSFAEGTSYSVGASWITSKGYLGAAFTRMESEYGLPGHSHINGVCHTHGLDLHCEAHGGFEDPFGGSDDHTAYIKLRSDRVDVRGDYDELLPGVAHTRLRLSYTDYAHDEIDGELLFSRFTNEVYDGRVELTHNPVFGFMGTLGVQYTDGKFGGINVNDLHRPFPDGAYGFEGSPDYSTENVGIFLSERRSFGSVDVEAAVRKDWRKIDVGVPTWRSTVGSELAALFVEWYGANWQAVLEGEDVERFRSRNPTVRHDPFSASLGATLDVGQGYALALSLGHSERAPSVRELYARGNNLATNSYELGLVAEIDGFENRGVSAEGILESTDAINLTLRKTGDPLTFEVGLFYQNVSDYVFARLIETENGTGVPHNFLIYTAADARFVGVDGQVSYQVTPASRITVFGDYVDAKLKSENDNLPRIPPGRLGARYEHSAGPLSGDVEYYHTFEQDKVASYETRTPGYDMLNATLSYRFDLGQAKAVELYVRGTNLLNELAFAHTSFVRDQSPLRGRNFAIGMRHAF
ncbi:iron complex outermembrane receptor protein [Sphingomonas endophytica]|uniref:Iron complex outermembrane receptor protein n=1 Tax=Sphingomonas endophytica TaxID=869719 RepID=A0A7X0JDM7_9SPHN|nr:TonB-dependent receptor [Sphingomonas endophytica]MBB6505630.1 iron complex outermembrane receptor protein [Sphingomonas endophytica]